MLLLTVAVGFVLLIVAANVANILRARAGARAPEVAIRLSLGAGRRRLVRQFLTESALLSLLGGALGIGFAFLGVRLVDSALPEALYRVGRLEVDGLALVFTCGVSLVAAVLFGLVPALRGTGLDLSQALKEAGGRSGIGGSRERLRGLLVVSQISLAVVLLAGAFSLLVSASTLHRVDLGFEPDRALTMRLSLPAAKYQSGGETAAFFDDLTRRLEPLPGIDAAAVSPLPLSFSTLRHRARGAGLRARLGGRASLRPSHHRHPHYFASLGIPLRRGRSFDQRDSADGPGWW